MKFQDSVFDAFNARALEPQQVARTFVPSPHFAALAKRRHTLILGPRGSGKTTLLKMLQQSALENWEHDEADAYRSEIDFVGVFIATDISWAEQIRSLGKGKLDSDSLRLLSVATFTTHVLRALILALIARTDDGPVAKFPTKRVNLSDEEEAAIVQELADIWKLRPAISSFLSVKHALSRRLLKIREIASKEITLGAGGRQQRLIQEDFLHLHFLQACSSGIEIFDDAARTNNKWALMFDELELAPSWLQEELVKSLRSTDERFLFKLALNPFNDDEFFIQTATSAAPDHDFEQIPLWYAEKRDSYEFCTQLWYQMLTDRSLPLREPRKVLGNSYFESVSEEWRQFGTAYAPGTRIATRFVELERKDASFRRYLQQHNIRTDQLHALEGDRRAAELRKIAPLVALREFYRAGDTASRPERMRSRKTAALYSGAESLFAVSEGNPRWFIAIVTRLLDRWEFPGKDKIPDFVQAEEMQKAAERFAALLKTLPVDTNVAQKLNLLGLIKRIAGFFHKEVVRSEFRPEPPGTFLVDNDVPDSIAQMIGQAIDAGALVYVPPDTGQLILTSVRHKRFRISYLLAPLYGLPIRLGKEIGLSRILQEKESGKLLFEGESDDNAL